ncbi:ABC transporter permease [Companilactobacillus huachuanensis]|uniref:ABC transporter permease n=1 Tax=Companilactobacillus huachuanensis TaxID=2559914 RepID=A0ABW1RPV2_9LACO|nr:ABC transporter permease [Companilactobacillus huachuanensis]
MKGLMYRNLKIYFSNKSGVFFSLMGALISFVLYLIFLRQNMVSSWSSVPDTKLLLDPWLIGGTLTITAITTTLSSLSLMVQDRGKNTLSDLSLTDVSYLGIQCSYLLTAMIVGIIMQLVMYFMMGGYFMIADNSPLEMAIFPQIFGIIVLSSFIWTAFNLLLLSFVKKIDTLGKIGTIVGTASGFLAGVYIPIGMLPTTVQQFMKYTPALYNTAIYRNILMNTQLQHSFKNFPVSVLNSFKDNMGISVKWGSQILTNQQDSLVILSFAVVISMVAVLIFRFSRRVVISRA